jgi:hypothetical protein
MHYLTPLDDLEPSFRPKTPTEFFALQLARRLNDVENVPRYVELTEHYRDDQILRALQGLAKSETRRGVEFLESELSRITNPTFDG